MKSKIYGLAAIGLVLSSCATTANYERNLSTWVGHNVSELAASWGAPASTMSLPNGTQLYKYARASAPEYSVNNNYFGGRTISSTQAYCETTFITDSTGVIQSWQWQGNACRAR